ncbi:MAG TPA: hypothetical protein PKC80_05825 [Burkholderiaceae bacterium]|nr:hypothetical protein [Burkholderiaceae bacterium]
MQSVQGNAYETAAKQASKGGGLTKQAPQRVRCAEGRARAQVMQRATGWAYLLTQFSHTLPVAGQASQTAHWLGIRSRLSNL